MSAGRDPRWQRYAALAIVLALAACAVIFRSRIGADFWPLDSSRVGPNLVAALVQAAVVLIVAALIWPPARRRAHRFLDRKLGGVHERLDALHARHDEHTEHLDRLGKSLAELHEKLDRLAD